MVENVFGTDIYNNAFPFPLYYPANNYPTFYYLRLEQEISALYLFNSLTKVVLVSDNIPVNAEAIASVTNNAGVPISRIILQDFTPIFDQLTNVRLPLTYLPSAQYRLIDMFGNIPLTNLNFRLLYLDNLGNFFDFPIPPNKSIDIKILFQLKSLFDNNPKLGY